MINYIDDNLLIASSEEEARLMGELTVTLMERLGFTVNRYKSVLKPVQSIQFLGFLLDSVEMKIMVPGSKLEKIKTMARTLYTKRSPQAGNWPAL